MRVAMTQKEAAERFANSLVAVPRIPFPSIGDIHRQGWNDALAIAHKALTEHVEMLEGNNNNGPLLHLKHITETLEEMKK